MSQSFKILFFLKKSKGAAPNSLPVYIRVTVNGERVEWCGQRYWNPSRWNQQLGRASGTKEDVRELNQYLEAVQANIFHVQKEFILRNEPITAGQVRAIILHKNKEKKHSLVEVYQYHNDQFEKLVGVEFSYGTFKKFKSALKSLKEFLEWKYNKKDVYLNEVNHKFITDYEFYLKAVKQLQHNSAMVNIKKLKKIIRLCVANDWLDKDPFRSYKITTRETHRNFLLKDELEILQTKEISVKRLEQVRDIFLFSCYTGLSYIDVMELTLKDIVVGIDGEQWIFSTRNKTNTATRIPLLPIAKEVIQKYSNCPKQILSGKLLPTLTNQRLNSYLKEIGDLCKLNKDLTFHCARHTFATTVTLTNGVPMETVSKMLGHKSLRTTQVYAKILDNKVSDDMKELRSKLAKVADNNPDKQLKA